MKKKNHYVFIVKSNYHGEHGQGNVLGVHATLHSALLHFDICRQDRLRRSELAWDVGPEDGMKDMKDIQWRMRAFYVIDAKSPETVELIRVRVANRRK